LTFSYGKIWETRTERRQKTHYWNVRPKRASNNAAQCNNHFSEKFV